jgi:outer membrane protein OmpA-like peptidoglycan-associated protein
MSVSADVEIVRPALGDEGVYGVEGAGVPDRWAWRVGLATQYERSPVLVLTEGEVTARPVTDRMASWAGFSMGFGYRLAAQVVLPVDWQTGTDSLLSSPGVGLGDPRLGVRWGAVHTQLVDATVRVDTWIPVGRREAWLGEPGARAAIGASGALHGGFGAILLDVGVVARPLTEPAPGFDWGPTADAALGARFDILPNLSAGASVVGRTVLAGLATQDGELSTELLASATYTLPSDIALTAGAGFGILPGAGVPTARGFLAATFVGEPPRKTPKPVVAAEDPPPAKRQAVLEEEIPGVTDVPPPPPPPIVRLSGDEILFREEIRFAPNSADILPESYDTLAATADLLARDGRILHVSIEGHASEDGDLVYNWDLSDRRARSVWEALVKEGVAPERMSWRGLGEVVPSSAGGAGVRPEDRRVVLRIARRLAEGEALPETPPTALLPWNGETVALDAVTLPVPEAPPPTDTLDPTIFDRDDDE